MTLSIQASRYCNAELHCHSTYSDGELTPSELVKEAIAANVEYLAITDHDNFSAYNELLSACQGTPVKAISGCEWSSIWKSYSVHLLALNFDTTHPLAIDLQKQMDSLRISRAQKIAQRLEGKGFVGVVDFVEQFVEQHALPIPKVPGRPHLAAFLVESGQISDRASAFSRFLGAGKIGDVRQDFPSFNTIIDVIHAAGGKVLIAHPHRYRMTWTKTREMIADFVDAGGDGIEVACPGMRPDYRQFLTKILLDYNLLASRGSDFHHREQHWAKIGSAPAIPKDLQPIWQEWSV